MKKTFIFAFTILTLITQGFAQEWGEGDTLKYHEAKGSIRLGGGINKNFPLLPKRTCLETTSAVDLDVSATTQGGRGALETTFDIEFIESSEQLHNLLSVSALIGAHKKFRGLPLPRIGLEGQGGTEKRLSKTSLSLVIKAKSNYGRQMLTDQEFLLKQKYQEMLDTGEFEKFEKSCGTHFVAWQKRQGVVSAIYTVENLTEKEKLQLRAAFEFGNIRKKDPYDPYDPYGPGGYPDPNQPGNPGGDDGSFPLGNMFGGGATSPTSYRNVPMDPYGNPNDPNTSTGGSVGTGIRLSLDNFLRSANRLNKKCALKFHAIGGDGMSGLGGMAAAFSCGDDNTQNITNLFSGLSQYFISYDFDKAPPVEYNLMPYFDFEPFEEDINHSLLKAVYYRYLDAEAYIVDLTKKMEDLAPSMRGSHEETYYATMIEKLDAKRKSLWDMAQTILGKSEQDAKTLNYKSIPKLPKVELNKFAPTFVDTNYIFNCYVKVKGSDTRCGMPSNYYKYFRVVYYWEANFNLDVTITKPDKVELVNVYVAERAGHKELVASVERGKSKERINGDISFIDDTISMTLGKITQKRNRDLYVKYLSNTGAQLPDMIVELKLKNGSLIETRVSSPELVGAHRKWGKSKTKTYNDIEIPSI